MKTLAMTPMIVANVPGIERMPMNYLFTSPTTSLFRLPFRNSQITTLDIIPSHIFKHKHQILILFLQLILLLL